MALPTTYNPINALQSGHPLIGAESLKLAHLEPVAVGKEREVYEVPNAPEVVVKVLHAVQERAEKSALRRYIVRKMPMVRYRAVFAEQRAYVELSIRQPNVNQPLPVTPMHGFVLTDIGFGMVSSAVRDQDGALAPTLEQLWRDRPKDPELLMLFNDFVTQSYVWHMRANDIAPCNLVLDTSGAPRLVLVDGLGDRNAIPMRSFSRRWNARSLSKRYGRSAKNNGLVWNGEKRQFSYQP